MYLRNGVLNEFVDAQFPECTVIISEPVRRARNVKAVSKTLSSLNIYMLDNWSSIQYQMNSQQSHDFRYCKGL